MQRAANVFKLTDKASEIFGAYNMGEVLFGGDKMFIDIRDMFPSCPLDFKLLDPKHRFHGSFNYEDKSWI